MKMYKQYFALGLLSVTFAPSTAFTATVPLEPGNTGIFFVDDFFNKWNGTVTYQGYQLGTPTGGVVTDGVVASTDISFLFSLSLDSFTRADLPGLQNWFTNAQYDNPSSILNGVGIILGTGANAWDSVFIADTVFLGGTVEGAAWLQSPGNNLGTYDTVFLSVSNPVAPFSDFNFQGEGDATRFEAQNFIPQVPVPAAVWLFGSGLLGLIGIARRD